MKRQHPDNPDLFWCPKCETYKAKNEFHRNKTQLFGIANLCKDCSKLISERWRIENKEKKRASDARYREENQIKIKKAREKWLKKNPEKRKAVVARWRVNKSDNAKKGERERNQKIIKTMPDCYIKTCLRNRNMPISKETIEYQRHLITMRRTLKQFKKWKKEKENGSDHTDVHGKQQADEENNEWGLQA